MEDAVHFLSKETVVQAITRSATKVGLLFGLTCSISSIFKRKPGTEFAFHFMYSSFCLRIILMYVLTFLNYKLQFSQNLKLKKIKSRL